MNAAPLPGIRLRLFVSMWLIYAAFVTTNVVRETYLAVALATEYTIDVTPYVGLHPDLFEIEGRGAFINSNPGASIAGALPYLAARPAIAGLFRLKPALGAPKSPTGYDDPRPNRTKFMNEMRRRGLDVKLALAAIATQVGLMAPAGALAVVAMFSYLLARYRDQRVALCLAALYGIGTPLFFRTAFLNQNALLAHSVLATWLVLTWPRSEDTAASRVRAWAAAGAFLGIGLLMDYSAVPLVLVFGAWSVVDGWTCSGLKGAATHGGACIAGALGPVLVLLGYQWAAFGSPWFPAQRYMPTTELSVRGWNGFSLPTVELLWRNLFDLRYGLFAFCPLLIAGLVAPFVSRQPGDPRPHEVRVALLAVVALWLFNSANQFAHLQWNTGVRYLVPLVPLLFLLAAPVLRAMPRWAAWTLVAPTVLISVAVAMMREGVPESLRLLLDVGPTLPILVVLNKAAAAYAPMLAGGVQPFGVLSLVGLGGAIFVIWKARRGARPS